MFVYLSTRIRALAKRSARKAQEVGPGRRGAPHVLRHLGKIVADEALTLRRPGEAVALSRAPNEFAVVVGTLGAREKLFHQESRLLQIEGIGVAHEHPDLPLELRAERRPVALEDVPKVVVLFPVGGDFLVNGSGLLVVEEARIAVRSHRTVDGLEDVHLIAGASAGSEDQLEKARVSLVHEDLVVDGAHPRTYRRFLEAIPGILRVVVLVDVHELEVAEVDGVGREHPRAVEELRVEDLRREGAPAACRAAEKPARPTFAHRAEFLLY